MTVTLSGEAVEIFTDGACSGNPGPGGWGALLRYKGRERELAGGEDDTTNNRMEMMAAIMALEALRRPSTVQLYTDSVYLRDGKALKVGELFRNPELARALELIATQGPSAFYKGDIAKSILKTSARHRGYLDASDLADFQGEWVDPISTGYRGWRVYELPPNSQGLAALSMLNIMERFPLGSQDPLSADALHLKIEAQKLVEGRRT